MDSGASINATLKLNTTPFTESLKTTSTAVTKFKESMLDIGKNSNTVINGVQALSQAIQHLIDKLALLETHTKGVSNFKTFAQGLNYMAEAAQRLGSVATNSSVGIEKLNEVIKIFSAGVSSAEIRVKGLSNSLKGLSSSEDSNVKAMSRHNSKANEMENNLRKMKNELNTVAMGVERFNSVLATSSAEYSRAKRDMLNLAMGVEQFNAVAGKSQMEIDQERNKLIQLQRAIQQSEISQRKLSQSTVESSTSMQKQASSIDRASTSMARASTQASRLGRAFSSLKSIGMLVGSMLAYNFIHHLGQATNETIQSKSEMEGYFKMLNYGQRDIDKFNNALDQTVKRFQRVNKYSLGETISSIGVEFDLTTDEMIKAMDVTSMITSEYLRAGRNANEASLAVKDVLQGQFQRLSRETGVKGEQLKEAGWSGDVNDVNSLLDALRKVAENRNWDVFATKANSLNDVVTILQNRFGEWSAEMVNIVQPSIVNAFNVMMSVGGAFANVFEGIWKWLNGTGAVETATRWGLIATSIGAVSTALVVYRTGANLTQLVQMGLRGSIIATTLGLKAEEVATYGSRNAIISRLTSLKAEQVADMGSYRAIAVKVLGLKAESVANMGVKGAIMESVLARKMEEAEMMNATVQQKVAIASLHQEEVARLSTTKTIFAHIAGLNMETFAQKGVVVALAERVASSPLYIGALEAEEVAELSTAEAGLLLAGTLTPLIAIFVGLAVAVYGLIKPLQDASEEMKSFNNLVEKGDEIIKSNKNNVDNLTKSKSDLEAQLGKLEKGTKAYYRKQDQINTITKDLKTANDNYTNSIKAVEMARSRQSKFEDERDKIRIHNQTELADAYIKAGVSAQEASELASHEMNDAKKGAEQLRKALQMIKFEADKGSKKNNSFIKMFDNYGLSKDKIKQLGTHLSEAQYKISEGLEKFMTSDDLMDRIGGWFEIQQGRFEEWWTELNAFFEVRDWDSMRDKVIEGFKYVLTGFGAFNWIGALSESIDKNGIIGAISNFIFGEGDSDGAWDIISSWANSMIIQPLASWLEWFFEDPVEHFGEVRYDGSVWLGKLLFGKNSDGKPLYDMTQEWIDTVAVPSITDAIVDYFSLDNVMEGNFTFGGVGAITSALPKLLFGEDASLNSIIKSITDFLDELPDPVEIIGNWLADKVSNWGSDEGSSKGSSGGSSIAKHINVSSILKNIIGFDWDGLYQWGVDIANALKSSIETAITNTPIVGDIAKLFGFGEDPLIEANTKGQDIGANFTSGVQTGFAPLDGIINNAFNLDGLVANFTSSTSTITSNASSTSSNVSSSFSTMRDNQKSSLDSMQSKNSSAFKNMHDTANTNMLNMRDSTSNITSQMTDAWTHMKDSIVSSAEKIKDESSSRFRTLSDRIGDFYRKIQNPSSWGSAGYSRYQTRNPRPNVGRNISRRVYGTGKHGAGVNPYTRPSQEMSIGDLTRLLGSDKKVKVSDFLSMFDGGFGGWDYTNTHTQYIKNKSDKWSTGRARITGIGSVGNGYEVSRWNTATPKFTWDEFMATASDIFSAIPYKFYYDSEWKGNWVNALLSGATNCSDGSDALIALANVFGFSGFKQHTTLKDGVGHFFAIINGHKLDTTHFQNSGSWSPLGGAGQSPRHYSKSSNGVVSGNTYNVTVDMSNSTIYGVDDLDNRIEEGTRKVMREEINDPFTVPI